MSIALYYTSTLKNGTAYDPVRAARWQADQVSAISIMNFLGRIFIGIFNLLVATDTRFTTRSGMTSDFYKTKLGLPRSYSLVLVSLFFLLSQTVAASIDDIRNLWVSSFLLGFAHGSIFSLLCNVCLEWFGLRM